MICDSHMDIGVNCTFDRTTCGYTNTEGQSQWTLSGTGSYGLGLPADHTSGNGEKNSLPEWDANMNVLHLWLCAHSAKCPEAWQWWLEYMIIFAKHGQNCFESERKCMPVESIWYYL